MHNKTLILCDSCGTKFNINSDEIYEIGRFVRCSVCEHEWLIKKDIVSSPQYETKRSSAEEPKEILNNTIVISKVCRFFSTKLFFVYGVALCLFFAIFFGFSHNRYSIQYQWNKMKNALFTHDLALRCYNYRILLQHQHDNPTKSLDIRVTIHNPTQETKTLRYIEVIGLNAKHQQVLKYKFRFSQEIKPNNLYVDNVSIPFSESKPLYMKIKVLS